MINLDIPQARWGQIRSHAKYWWAQLSDDDLDQIGGRCDRLVGAIQRRYGGSREEAEADVNRFLLCAKQLLRLL